VLEAVKNPIAYFFAMMAVFLSGVVPPSPPTLMAAKVNPPWLLATLAALAAAITAVFDYYVVRRAFRIQTLDRVRRHRLFDRAERWAKVAPFFTVAVFAAFPLPFIIPRVLVPVSGYPVARYAVAVALGRWPRIFVIAAFGKVVDVPTWMLEGFFAGALVVAALGALFRRLGWIRGPDLAPASLTPAPQPAIAVAAAAEPAREAPPPSAP
jgi:uncharacterized membrane protein YdjX (TVP38/TMEM64 family)